MKITGLGGVVSGRKGDIIMYVRKGQTLGRQYQPHVANPDTLNQRAARAKFKRLAFYASQARHAAEIGFGEATSNRLQSGYNLFIKYNPLTVTVNPTGDSVTITEELTSMQVSKGNMQGVSFSALSFETPATIKVTGSLNKMLHKNTAMNMGACFVVYIYNPEINQGFTYVSEPVDYEKIMESSGDSYTEVLSIKVPDVTWQGLKVHVYGFGKLIPEGVYSLNRRYPAPATDTVYLGSGEVA